MPLLGLPVQKKEGVMARISRPRQRFSERCYRADVKGARLELLKGEESDTNFKLAEKQLRQVTKGTKSDTATAALPIADVIERYLLLHRDRYSPRAVEERRRYLQLFAQPHGFR